MHVPCTAKPPFSSGSQSSSFCLAPDVTTYRVFYMVAREGQACGAVVGQNDNAHLRVCLDLKPPITQMALAAERIDGRRVVVPDLLLLCVVPNAHANVVVTCATVPYKCVRRSCQSKRTYHQMLNGNSNRVMRMPWSSFRALSPSACFPVYHS